VSDKNHGKEFTGFDPLFEQPSQINLRGRKSFLQTPLILVREVEA